MPNQLTIKIETGENKVVTVYDIIDSLAFSKTFIIYSFVDEPEALYASILNEKETSYSFDEITNPDELQYIEAEVKRVANELQATL